MVRCLVPFCKRTTPGRDEDEEWICPAHFARVDGHLHRTYDALHKKAVEAEKAPGAIDAPIKIEVYARITEIWKQCVKQALERGVS